MTKRARVSRTVTSCPASTAADGSAGLVRQRCWGSPACAAEGPRGRGLSARDLLADRRTVAEGAFTAPVLREAARDAGLDMPVCEAVCRLLEGAAAAEVIGALLARPLRDEAA